MTVLYILFKDWLLELYVDCKIDIFWKLCNYLSNNLLQQLLQIMFLLLGDTGEMYQVSQFVVYFYKNYMAHLIALGKVFNLTSLLCRMQVWKSCHKYFRTEYTVTSNDKSLWKQISKEYIIITFKNKLEIHCPFFLKIKCKMQ